VPTPALTSNALPVSPARILSRYWLILLVVLAVAGGAAVWFRSAFVDTGYAPTQPIAFSHLLHAGVHKIDCQFCHFQAGKGKHAGIPPMSVCLGCHQNGLIANDRPEVAKLLKIAQTGSYEADGVVHDGGVVHWKRVHKLPDHVYFTHEHHIAAGIACATCHGPVAEMAVMRQHSDLTMGWCLDCHRDNHYVTNPAKGDAAHRVGTASYGMTVGRMEPDPVVVFHQRRTKDAPAEHQDATPGHAGDHSHGAAPAPEPHAAYRERLATLMARYPDLPRWRVADLPSSHRAYLETVGGLQPGQIDNQTLLSTYMNAPTQCSTCHQ
jgi:hypothetical protein